MVTPEDIKMWIEAGLANTTATVDGDGYHFEALVICPDFLGKNTVARHRLVYTALGDRMRAEIHALSLKTLTPDEAKR
jgi:acid stress-induced BolA-like protein IbaG/YrbA